MRVLEYNEDTNTFTVTCKCFCGAETVLEDVPGNGYARWQDGGIVIQKALPTLSPAERETLITGLCVVCQSDIFTENDDDVA